MGKETHYLIREFIVIPAETMEIIERDNRAGKRGTMKPGLAEDVV